MACSSTSSVSIEDSCSLLEIQLHSILEPQK